MPRSFPPAPADTTNIVAGFSIGLPPPIDPVELLPVSRRARFLALRQGVEDAGHLVRPLQDRLDDLRSEKHMLTARIADLKAPRGRSFPHPDNVATSVADAEKKAAAIDAEMTRLGELLEVRSAIRRNRSALVQNLEAWLRSGRPGGTAIAEADIPAVATIARRGETSAVALDRLRRRLRELNADEHGVRSAPYPAAHAKVKARAMVDALAARGAPDLSSMVEAGFDDIRWPMAQARLGLAAVVGRSGDKIVGSALGEQPDVLALFAYLHRDALVARLEQEIDTLADDAAALSVDARAEKLAEISQDRLLAERAECALIAKLQAEGAAVEYRADADVRAVLGIELQVAARPIDDQPFGLAAMAAEYAVRGEIAPDA